MQDFSWVQWQSKDNSKMMLKNECLCTFFEMFSKKQSALLYDNYSNGRMET
jgi:hypothetical protein